MIFIRSSDYISSRLNQLDSTKELGRWLQSNMEPMKEIPRYLIPAYFDAIITGVYELLIQQVLNLMPRFVVDPPVVP
jgi:glycogen debranching enzyme